MAMPSTMYKSSMRMSYFSEGLFSQRSILLSNSMMGVVLGGTQFILDRLQVLWFLSKNRSLKREMAQQFIYFSQSWLQSGSPRTYPVSVSIIQQKLPINLTFLINRYFESGSLFGSSYLLMMNLLPWESSRPTQFSILSPICTSFNGLVHFLSMILKGQAITQKLLTRLMPNGGLYLQKKYCSNHLDSLLALNTIYSVLTSLLSGVVVSELKISRLPALTSKVYNFYIVERYFVSSLISFQSPNEKELRQMICPILLEIQRSLFLLLNTQTEQYLTKMPQTCSSFINSSTIFNSIIQSLSRYRYKGRVISINTPITDPL